MKKLICILLSVLLIGATSFAQDKAPQSTRQQTKKSENINTNAPKMAQPEQAKPKLKKDGTPDMRYAENKKNKVADKPAGPVKKDGTPDMRHKANKQAAAAKQDKK